MYSIDGNNNISDKRTFINLQDFADKGTTKNENTNNIYEIKTKL